jgi:C4-dicarboxylate-specific signal transduction histidine kinase
MWSPGLRNRLVLLVLIAVLPALVLVVHTSFQLRRTAKGHAEEAVLTLARLAAVDLQQYAEGAHQFLIGVAQAPALQSPGLPACGDFLTALQSRTSNYTVISVANPYGDLICTSGPLPAGVNLSDRYHFQLAMETRQFAVGDFVIGRVSGKPSLNAAHPMLDEQGEVRAVLLIGLDLTWLSRLGSEAQLPPIRR